MFRRKRSRGQSLVEAVIVLGVAPIMVIMVNAIIYFGQANSLKIRTYNFARYAAMKEARREVVNIDGALTPNNRIVPQYVARERSDIMTTIGAVAFGAAMAFTPYLNADLGNGITTQYSGIPFIVPGVLLGVLASQHPPTEVFAQTIIPPPSGLPFVGARVVKAEAVFDALTFKIDRLNPNIPNAFSVGYGLFQLSFIGPLLSVESLNRGSFMGVDFGLIENNPQASGGSSDLSLFFYNFIPSPLPPALGPGIEMLDYGLDFALQVFP